MRVAGANLYDYFFKKMQKKTLKVRKGTNRFSRKNKYNFTSITAIKKIGGETGNGFVTELKFAKQGYAVLKSTSYANNDNLMYEFRVGQYINTLTKIYPCFINTYSLHKYVSKEAWEAARQNQLKPSTFHAMVAPFALDWKTACDTPKRLCHLIEHIRVAKTAREIIQSQEHYAHLFPILFQIYFPLYHLRKKFTHYDLHWENVVLTEPKKGKYIQFHYKTETGVVSFKSIYVAKIIDYGRCYFDDGKETSLSIYKKICKLKNCRPTCGWDKGFKYFDLKDADHLICQKKNESADLRFLKILLDYSKPWQAKSPDWFQKYLEPYQSIVYGNLGTPERSCKKKVCDLTAVYDLLNVTLPLSNVQFDPLYNDKFADFYIAPGEPFRCVFS